MIWMYLTIKLLKLYSLLLIYRVRLWKYMFFVLNTSVSVTTLFVIFETSFSNEFRKSYFFVSINRMFDL